MKWNPPAPAVDPAPAPVALVDSAGTACGHGRFAEAAEQAIDPSRERDYWNDNFRDCDYVKRGSSFDDYGPAYGIGVKARGRYPGSTFDDVEAEISSGWIDRCEASSLSWDLARLAARDAWNRISPSR